jgi:hypothetical protein
MTLPNTSTSAIVEWNTFNGGYCRMRFTGNNTVQVWYWFEGQDEEHSKVISMEQLVDMIMINFEDKW